MRIIDRDRRSKSCSDLSFKTGRCNYLGMTLSTWGATKHLLPKCLFEIALGFVQSLKRCKDRSTAFESIHTDLEIGQVSVRQGHTIFLS